MESKPLTTENDSDKKEPRRKKKPESIGALIIDPQKAAPERIGHVVIEAEAMPERLNQIDTPDIKLLQNQNIATLNRAELMNISEKIEVNGSNLRQIYETHLIGERGLRRLVSEFLRGGDVRKALKREVLQREIDFERDPVLRDMPQFKSQIGSNAALQNLLSSAYEGLENSSEEAAFFKARTDYELKQQVKQIRRRRIIDFGLVSTIMILLILVIMLYFSHH